MKLRKGFRRMVSMLLAAVMSLAMAMTGLAATITVNNSSEGETYKAYKIFDVTTTSDSSGVTSYSYTIDSTSPWYNVVSQATSVFTLNKSGDSTIYYVTVKDGVDDADVTSVFTDAVTQGDVDLSQIDTDGTATANNNGVAYITNLDTGYYFVTTSLGSLVMIDTADTSISITEKNDVPTPDKKILEGDDAVESESSDNNKTVTYVLYAKGVKGAVNLVIHDQMTVDDGITYTFDYNNMSVGLYDISGTLIQNLGTGTTSTYYTFEKPEAADEGEDAKCDFHIIFNEAAEALFASCGDGSYVMVTIDCSLDAGEYTFEDDEVDIKNKEKVTYGSSGNSKWDVVDVYEYGFEIYKYTGSDESIIALANAEFELTNASDEKAYFIKDSTTDKYVLEAWGTEPTDGKTYTTTIVTDKDGKAYIEGLGEGEYTLTETNAPEGYNLLDKAITVTISANNEDMGQFTVTQDGTALSDHIVNVENNSGTKLPGTGGMGTTLFYIVGAVLVLGAAALFVTKKRLDR